jgi:hypothetical protein
MPGQRQKRTVAQRLKVSCDQLVRTMGRYGGMQRDRDA